MHQINPCNPDFNTPVVLFIFNRPDTTQLVFDSIKKIRPSKLYIISDGPRDTKSGEYEKVAQSRKIATSIDWECNVILNFSDKNMGCKRRISSGIDFVFSSTEEAIFLEDDCVPNETFFYYCSELLERYRHNDTVTFINGTNHIGELTETLSESYYFTRYPHVHGWASWAKKWKKGYDVDLREWPNVLANQLLNKLFSSKEEERFWKLKFNAVYNQSIDTWDYQVAHWMFLSSKLAVAPKENLITNIGYFREDATHTSGGGKFANLPSKSIPLPLTHPKDVKQNIMFDRLESNDYSVPNIFARYLKRILRTS
jgi:hypothetical protein